MTKPGDPDSPNNTAESESAASAPESEYTVGYGKPPLPSRFKPGHSGNPKGRPKHSRNLKTIVAEELKASVTVTENGRRRNMPARQALIKKLKQLALQGDLKAVAQLLALDQTFLDREEGADIQPFDAERDKETIASFLHQLKENANG